MANRKLLRECCTQSTLEVDEDSHFIRNVKILGFDSSNYRRYLPKAVQRATHMYEGASVNVDHLEGNPNATRGLRDRFGWLTNCNYREDGLYGDLGFNPAHPLAETILWWAKNQPSQLGLSHNAVGQGETRDGVFVVEKIISVRSVDLVTEPATTRGLYEGRNMPEADDLEPDLGDTTANLDGEPAGPEPEPTGEGDWKAHLLDGIKKVLADEGLDPALQLKLASAIMRVVKSGHAAGNGGDEGEEEPGEEEMPMELETEAEEDEEECPVGTKTESRKRQQPRDGDTVKALREELDQLKAREAVREREVIAHRLCKRAGLPRVAITAVFMEQLTNCEDEKQMQRLVEDRKKTCGIRRPLSSLPGGGTSSERMDAKGFAKALRGGNR